MGCSIANMKHENEEGLENRCAFCREPTVKSEEEAEKNITERIKKKCPVAMREMGKMYFNKGDYDTAFKYYTKAAELGDVDAHFHLSHMFHNGDGIENDTKKARHHAEQAAIAGHPTARYNLGAEEMNNGNFVRAVKHFIIAANLGDNDSLNRLKDLYTGGDASKEDYANALRAYQAAVEATKSSEREIAEEDVKNGKAVGSRLFYD
jgi:TPR repeat protein